MLLFRFLAMMFISFSFFFFPAFVNGGLYLYYTYIIWVKEVVYFPSKFEW